MTLLWDHYVFRRAGQVNDLWDELYAKKHVKVLYIGGRGFDVRTLAVLQAYVDSVSTAAASVSDSELILIGSKRYRLDSEIQDITDQNAASMASLFEKLGTTSELYVGSADDDEELSTSSALRQTVESVLEKIDGYTDVVLDISSLPRIVYLTLLTSILSYLVSDREIDDSLPHPLARCGVNFQVLVGEDAALDANILAQDPSNELVLIPGYSAVMQLESAREWPVVWFPILGENRVNQFEKVLAIIPPSAEICPVLPHPSRDPRRADRLLVEYRVPLIEGGRTETANLLHAHESHPFEAYRQLLNAMRRYRESFSILGGCRLIVTPLGSKLITLGAGIACFEMQSNDLKSKFGVAIPYAEPTRYVVTADQLRCSTPVISALILTGEPYCS